MDKDKFLLGYINDKLEKSKEQYIATNSQFMDLRQGSLIKNFLNNNSNKYVLYGGYREAERKIVIFFPEYVEYDNRMDCEDFFRENGEYNPIRILRVIKKGKKQLNHRDYLGSLLSIGIKREVIGDILVRDDGADIFVLEEIAEYINYNYIQAGNVSLSSEILKTEEVLIAVTNKEEKLGFVSSLRLDNLVSTVFKVSRSVASDSIKKGLIFIDGVQILKVDKIIAPETKIVFRGKGKVVLVEIVGMTKKERVQIKWNVYC